VAIYYNDSLASIEFGAASSIGGALSIGSNRMLTLIDFGSLTSVGPSLGITYNQRLPNCQATNLRDQLLAAGWTGSVYIYGNDYYGTCP
jgi:hypothetical protein